MLFNLYQRVQQPFKFKYSHYYYTKKILILREKADPRFRSDHAQKWKAYKCYKCLLTQALSNSSHLKQIFNLAGLKKILRKNFNEHTGIKPKLRKSFFPEYQFSGFNVLLKNLNQ